MKKIISIILVLCIVYLGQMAGISPVKGYAEEVLSDEMAEKFVEWFYQKGTEEADNMIKILRGEKRGNYSEVKSIFANACSIYGIFNQPEMIEALTSSTIADYAKYGGGMLGFAGGAVEICENISCFSKSESSMKKVVYGFKMGLNVLSVMQLNTYVPSGMGMAIEFIDLGITAGGFIEKASFMEGLSLYESDLMMAYYLGEDLPYKKAPTLLIGSELTQTEADALYASKYMEYYLKRVFDKMSETIRIEAKFVLNYPNSQDIVCHTAEETLDFIQNGMYEQKREGYTFVNWYYDAEGTIEFDGDFYKGIVLYAKWKQTKCTITFNSNCSEVPNFSYVYDTTVGNWIDYTMERPGYVNEGWYWDSACTQRVTGTITIDRDLTFYAKWVRQFNYTVSGGKAKITGIVGYKIDDGVTITDIEIPAVIDGYSVTEIGNNAFKNSTITGVTIPDNVETIGNSAFYGCDGLENITIGESVETIGDYAFRYCDNLESVIIGENVENIMRGAFYGCVSLKTITIPNNVKTIGDSAFNGCDGLENITIGESVETIGDYAFGYCYNLESVTIGENVENIMRGAFHSCVSLKTISIPNNVKTISDSAFDGCESLMNINVLRDNDYYLSMDGILFSKDKSVLVKYPEGKNLTKYIIPEEVKLIGSGAFERCKLISIDLGKNVESIGAGAFSECELLNDVIIPNTVTTIGFWAFRCCFNLTNIILPNGITRIEDDLFLGCENLTNITIPKGVKTIGETAFAGCIELKNVKIPDGVTTIGAHAFGDCELLDDVIIPNTVTAIGEGAFNGCSGLTNIKLSDKITTINAYLFSACTSLTNITIPKGVQAIGELSFNDCLELTCVKIPDGVTSIGSMAFDNCPKLMNIEIPNSITSWGANVFGQHMTVYYRGTPEQWDSIDFAHHNEYLPEKIIFVKHTKTDVSEDGKIFTVNPINIDEGETVIIALYKGGKLEDVQHNEYKSEELEFTTTADYDEVKVMVWEDFEKMTPITDVEELN